MEKEGQDLARWTDIVENQIYTTNNVRLEDIENAFAHITEQADKGLYGICNYYMAYYNLRHGKPDECLDYLREGIRCMVGTPQERNVSRCYNMLGVIAHGQNNLLMAAEQYNKALTYAARYKDHFLRNIVISNMADMYYRMGAYEKAFQCFKESMVEYDRSGDDTATGMRNYMMLLSNYGYCLTLSGRVQEARKVARQLEDLHNEKYGDQFPGLYAYTFFALLCHKLNQDEDACDSLERAVQDVTDKREIAGDFDGVLNLLELLVVMEKYDYLEAVLDSVEPLAEEENNNGLMLQLLVYRIKYCGSKLSEEQYMECAKRFFHINEVHGNSETSLVIHMMEMSRRLWSIEEEQRELEQENTRLLYQVDHDELSGLYNKRYLNQYLEDVFDRAVQEELALSVIFVDIDYFKQLNDHYGHQKGDECIQAVAEVLKENMADDFAARYGGDEFVAVALGRTEQYIRDVADRIVEGVRRKQISNVDSAIADILTVTAGIIHAVPQESDRVWDFMAAADDTLYQQKKEKKGRARFCGRL